MTEARNTCIDQYPNLAAFFTHELPKAHDRLTQPRVIVSPTDGRLLAAGRIDGDRLIQAKNHCFSCNDLLGGDNALASNISSKELCYYLSFTERYYRVHMPLKAF